MDPPHGGAGHDRAVRARPGTRAQRHAHRELRHFELRLRHPLRRRIQIFTNINSTIVDPKAFDPNSFVDLKSDVCIIPPNSFALARTVDISASAQRADYLPWQEHLCTLRHHRQRDAARTGVGRPRTLEFSNTTPLPAKIYARGGLRPGDLHRERRGVRNQLPRPRRQYQGRRASLCPRPDKTIGRGFTRIYADLSLPYPRHPRNPRQVLISRGFP